MPMNAAYKKHNTWAYLKLLFTKLNGLQDKKNKRLVPTRTEGLQHWQKYATHLDLISFTPWYVVGTYA